MRLDAAKLTHFTDREIALGRDWRQGVLGSVGLVLHVRSDPEPLRACQASARSRRLFDLRLELLARMEGDDPPGGDGDFLACLGIAPRALGLVAQLEVAEARELDRLAPMQGVADLVEESLDHVLGFALV